MSFRRFCASCLGGWSGRAARAALVTAVAIVAAVFLFAPVGLALADTTTTSSAALEGSTTTLPDLPAGEVSAAATVTVTDVSPPAGPLAGGATVTITGEGFTGATSVIFGAEPATDFLVVSDTEITAVTPAQAAGKVDLSVTSPSGMNSDTATDDYTYVDVPTISTLSPTAGSGSGGTTVTINGTGFIGLSGPSAVTFGGIPASSYNVVSSTQVTAVTPAHAAGEVSVAVTAAGGTSGDTTADNFTFNSPPPATTRYEQSDSRFAYGGAWTNYSTSAVSGGSCRYTNASGTSVTIKFTGTYLSWIGIKSSMYGIAKVTVDSESPVYVDLYSSSPVLKTSVWNTGILDSGTHTVTIQWTGTKNTASTGTYVGVDAFDVAGTLVQASVPLTMLRYEQNDTRLGYVGAWTTYGNSGLSGGSYKFSNAPGAAVTVVFNGTYLGWVTVKGPMCGTAKVTVDGGTSEYVDLYSPTTIFKTVVWNTGTLTAGNHTVKIQCTGYRNDASTGTYVGVDAFDILGVMPWSMILTSGEIRWMEQKLTDLSYRPGTVDGVFDYKTRGAIIGFEKWEGLTRDGVVDAAVWARLQTASRPKPSRTGGSNPWIEINKSKQVLLYCRDGAVVWTLPVSTGSSIYMVTPSGTFKVQRKTWETNPRYLPLYIRTSGYLAIHGYPKVPVYPASHGCIRTQKWDQDVLHPLIGLGTYVYIY